MLTCRDAAKLLSISQDQSLSHREQWALKMHLLFCSSCRRYARQLRWMDQLFHLAAGRWSTFHLSPEARKKICTRMEEAERESLEEPSSAED
ncbi:hypothetical protein B1757_04650 [Acidithiobacillus marinus]|uniref:Putative zinc-finger domain-containing protein n=2 Tax=Acidithiobacillus marinus TaxID=187490 RepID=A0A2I1DNQ2_9PROT|nr:zf-HC2 domain-containing protein [Acidithiobacillus marinus]PKY11524.1 hypothetical protein B1757_04650 [Acidithiobacillus marinus]